MNIVKYTKKDFLTASEPTIEVDAQLTDLPEDLFTGTPVVNVPECHISGTLHYDGKSRVISRLELSGVMTVPDSITGEDVDVDFDTESETEYSFDPIAEQGADAKAGSSKYRAEDALYDADEASSVYEEDGEEVVIVKMNTIDLMDEIIQAIVYEAPMSITRLDREDFPQGEGWTLISDQDPVSSQQQEDPRWAKLKEFKIDDD